MGYISSPGTTTGGGSFDGGVVANATTFSADVTFNGNVLLGNKELSFRCVDEEDVPTGNPTILRASPRDRYVGTGATGLEIYSASTIAKLLAAQTFMIQTVDPADNGGDLYTLLQFNPVPVDGKPSINLSANNGDGNSSISMNPETITFNSSIGTYFSSNTTFNSDIIIDGNEGHRIKSLAGNIFASFGEADLLFYNGVSGGQINLSASSADGGIGLVVNGNAKLAADVNGIRLQPTTVPATSSESIGSPGHIRIDSSHIYISTATDTWKRVALSTF